MEPLDVLSTLLAHRGAASPTGSVLWRDVYGVAHANPDCCTNRRGSFDEVTVPAAERPGPDVPICACCAPTAAAEALTADEMRRITRFVEDVATAPATGPAAVAAFEALHHLVDDFDVETGTATFAHARERWIRPLLDAAPFAPSAADVATHLDATGIGHPISGPVPEPGTGDTVAVAFLSNPQPIVRRVLGALAFAVHVDDELVYAAVPAEIVPFVVGPFDDVAYPGPVTVDWHAVLRAAAVFELDGMGVGDAVRTALATAADFTHRQAA